MTLKQKLGDVRRMSVGVAQRPAAARHVPRMISTMGKQTLDLRQAWLPFELMDRLSDRLTRTSAVFEYGGGGSTAWFADRVGSVITVEHEPDWVAILDKELSERGNVTLLSRSADNAYADYVAAIDSYPDDSFDVVIVDGRERVRCFERAVPKVRPGGLLLLDDVERLKYQPAFDLVDWPREIVRDFAPCKASLAHTAVFTRPLT